MNEAEESEHVIDDTASKINMFKKAREIEQINFDVYVYRVLRDSNRKISNPFLTKYENYLPDELEIAERFRGGKYKLQAIWYNGGKQKSESWSYEIDSESFPPQSPLSNIVPPGAGGDMTQNMMFLVADIVKTAYANRPTSEIESQSRRDPLEMFSEVQNKMQDMYTNMINIQANVMERSFQAKLENKYGLNGSTENQYDDNEEGEGAGVMESGIIEIVKQIVDAAKLVLPILGIPGTKPVIDGIKNNPAFSKYAELAKNPLIVKEVAQALRKEYGNDKAGLLLKSFGISMVARPGNIPSRSPVKEVPATVVAAGTSKVVPGTKKPSKNNIKLSNVKKG